MIPKELQTALDTFNKTIDLGDNKYTVEEESIADFAPGCFSARLKLSDSEPLTLNDVFMLDKKLGEGDNYQIYSMNRSNLHRYKDNSFDIELGVEDANLNLLIHTNGNGDYI